MDATSPTTELQAVNIMLSLIGEMEIDDLSLAASNADVQMALFILRSATRTVQTKGWQFNTETGRTLYRGPNSEIALPSNAVRCSKPEDPQLQQEDVRFTIRGQRLFNQTTNSFVWDVDVVADLTLLLPFEELPEPARNYIAEKAAQRFQDRKLGSTTLRSFTADDMADASVALMDYELDDGVYNLLVHPSTAAIWLR
jgi:hypothetical protein